MEWGDLVLPGRFLLKIQLSNIIGKEGFGFSCTLLLFLFLQWQTPSYSWSSNTSNTAWYRVEPTWRHEKGSRVGYFELSVWTSAFCKIFHFDILFVIIDNLYSWEFLSWCLSHFLSLSFHLVHCRQQGPHGIAHFVL